MVHRDISMRLAEADDALIVWLWRNDPATREASFDTREVPWEAHERWFGESLRSPDRYLLIIQVDREDSGVVRFDRMRSDEWEISINLAPRSRGQGLSSPILRASAGWLHQRYPSAGVYARVREENVRSLRAFVQAGYQEVDRQTGEILLALSRASDA